MSNTARVENVEASGAPFSQPKPKQQQNFLKPHQKVWRVKQTIKDEVQKLGDSKSGAKWRGQQFSVQEVKPLWLTTSWVGMLREYRIMEAIREHLLHGGLEDIRVRYFGDKAILLTTNEEILMKDLMEENKECLTEI